MEFASRDQWAICPVTGWWRDRPSQERHLDKARYELVVTLEAREADVDLKARVAETEDAVIAARVAIKQTSQLMFEHECPLRLCT